MAGREIVNRQVNIYIQSGDAQKAYDVLISKEKGLNAELAKTTDPKRLKKLHDDLDKLKEPIDRAGKKLRGEVLPTFRDLESSTKKWLNEYKKFGDPAALKNFEKFSEQLQVSKKRIDAVKNAQEGLDKKGIFSAAFWASLASSAIVKVTSLLGNFFGGVVQEALDADAATRRLESTLNNLGRSDAFDRISRKADDLAQTFRYLDNDDIVAVFNKLIDYGKLTEQQMNQLLPVIIDFAAKSQISIGDSASVIIKALEGNGKALKEYGIDIKDGGDETERLNIIMTTLKQKVDGAGDAFQNSMAGGIATARQQLNNIKEDIGNKILPALNALLSKLLHIGGRIKAVFKAIGDEINGKNGFITLALDEVDLNNPKILAQVEEITDQTVAGIKNLITHFNVATKEGLVQYQVALKSRMDNIENSIKEDQLRIKELQKSMGRSGQDEAKQLLIGIIARQKALDEIRALLSTDDKTLGIDAGDSVPTKIDRVEKDIKKLKTAWENLLEIQRLAKQEVEQWGIATEKTLHKQEKTVTEIVAIMGKLSMAAENAIGEKGIGNAPGDNRIKDINNREQQQQWADEEAALQRKLDIITKIADALNTAVTIGDTFFQAMTNRENAELEKDRRWNDRKRQNLESRLKSGLLTQLQYNREIDKINQEQEKKERKIKKAQFERERTISIAQILISSGEGIAKTIAKMGFPAAIPALLVQAAIIASKIALINSQEPKFAAGGMLGGRSHASGGNAVVDGNGRKIAELEAGEGIVNKRTMADSRQYTATGTPSQIASELNSLYGVSWTSGGRLIPKWANINPRPINFPAIQKYYAAGGRFNSNTTTQPANGIDIRIIEHLTAVIADMQQTISAIQRDGIISYSILTQQEKQQARMDAIRADATMQ